MNKITSPLKLRMQGPQVADLQDALLLFLDRGVIQAPQSLESPTIEELARLRERLQGERAAAMFGEATQALVLHFQEQQRLGERLQGEVDATTAARMNAWLERFGLLEEPAFVVRGRVLYANGAPLVGAVVRAWDRDLRTEQLLGETLTDAEGQYLIGYDKDQFGRAEKGQADLIVRVYDPAGQLLMESPLVWADGRESVVDLVELVSQPSEWESITADIRPLLNLVLSKKPSRRPNPTPGAAASVYWPGWHPATSRSNTSSPRSRCGSAANSKQRSTI